MRSSIDRYAGVSVNTDLSGATVSSVDQALFTSSGGAELSASVGRTDVVMDSPVLGAPAPYRPVAVPEPASMLLVGTGLAAVAGRRKRRRE